MSGIVNPTQPTSEALREFLVRRGRELSQQISALRGQITPKEQELAEIQKAMEALGLYAQSLGLSTDVGALTALPADKVPAHDFVLAQIGSQAALAPMTIKQMILNALRDHFRAGAAPAELREYIRTAYGREVDRNSISPQLARLRDEGLVEQAQALGMLNEGKWQLRPSERQRAFYGMSLAEQAEVIMNQAPSDAQSEGAPHVTEGSGDKPPLKRRV